MKIRRAVKKDISAISRLIKEMAVYHRKFDRFYKTSLSSKAMKLYIEEFLGDKNKIVMVAEEGKEIIGYIFGSIKTYPIYISLKNL